MGDLPRVTVRAIEAEQTHALRHSVLRPHQTLAEMVYPADAERGTVHFGAFVEGRVEPVGIVTLSVEDRGDAAWRLRGMATDPAVRGAGAGKLLVDACVEHAAGDGAGSKARPPSGSGIWCNARMSAVGFYERCGFVVVTDEFEIEGIGPHVVMERLSGGGLSSPRR